MTKKLFTAVLALMAFCNVVGAATHTTTFTRTDFTQKGQTCTYDGDVSWTNNGTWKAFDTLGAYFGWSSTKALQFGSTSNPCSEFSLTSGSFAGKTVTKVTVNSSTGTAAEATCTVSVGGKSFGTKTLTTDPTDYEFTGSASGDVVVSWAQTTERALYVKTITVEYEDAAGGSQQSETTVYDSGVFGTLEAVWNVLGTKAINGVDWTLSAQLKEGATQPYFARNSTKGQQLGTANNPFTTINISTNAFAKAVKITKVEVNSSTAVGSDAVLSVTVGGKSFGTQQTLSTTASDYAFEGDAAGGNVVLTWTQTPENAKALYVKSIKVTYEKAAASVAKPVITLSSEATTNFAPVTVTINCETEGAAIHYTLDGTTPSDASTLYAEPFTVSENATIKAIAFKGGESSEVSDAANLTFGLGLANLAEFNALGSKEGFDKNTLVSVANDVTAIYHNRKYLYVKDNSGYALLFDTNSKYTDATINNGDVIPGGFFGKYSEFNMLPEMAYLDGVGELKAGTAVEPIEATVADITAENVNKYVKLSNVKLTAPVAKTFDMTDETGTVSCYNQFTVDMASLNTEKTYDVEGFVSISYDPQFYPTSITEHVAADGILYGTYAAPAALEDGKTYGMNADVTGGQFNYYTFESAEDVKITLTTTPGTNPGGGFGVSTGKFLMDDQYNDLEGAVDIRDELTTEMVPVGGEEGGIGGDDDFGVGFGNFTISSYWNAKAGVKYYIMCQGVGSFTVALSEPDMTEKVGTTENPINLNETPTWTWGTDGKVPGSATHYTFKAEKDGNLTISNGNEELYVGEDGWYDPFVNTSGPQYTGEIKKVTNWSDYTAAYTFAVEEGVTYCITIFDLTKGNDGEVIKAEFEEAVPVESVSILDPGNEVADGQTFIFENLGESYQFTAVVTPENATNKNVTWEVLQDSEVVTCEEGLVTLVGYGKAAVVVTTEDGEKQAYVNIFVQEKEPEKELATFKISNNGPDVTITPSDDEAKYSYAIVIPEIIEALGKTDRNELFDDLANMFFNVVSGEVTFDVLEDYLEYAGLEELAPGTEVEVLVSNVKKEDGEIVREGEITTYTFTYGEGGDEADNVEWDPAPGEIDYNSFGGHLDQVILTFTDAGMVEVNDIPFKANIEDETGREVDSMYGVNFFFLDWNQACITFNKGVSADGTYTVNVPAGLFTLTMPDGTTKASSELHATYIVTGAGEGPAPGGKMQILPAEGNVTSLQQFTLVINDWDSQFDSYNSKAQFYKDGELVEEVAFDYNPEDWDDLNLYGSLSAPVTADGTYTLEFPVGSMTTNSWASSNTEPVVYTWTIGEGGGEEELPIGTYAEPIALEDGKTYGLNAAETGMPNFYTFESDKDVKVILTPTEGSIVEGGFAVSTGNFLMDDQYNDLEGAEMVETMMEPVESGEPGIGGDDELGGDDFGWGMAPGRMATTWTAKAGVKYYIMTMGQGSFDVALDEPEEYVGTMETPINLNETTEWTWGTDGKLPGSTTYYTYTAERDGNLTVFVSNCAENQLYVGEDGWYDPYLHTDGPAYTGEIKTDYNWGALTETNTFAVEAGTTYFITIFDLYDETIKVSFEDATAIKGAAADKTVNGAYNIRGQKVDASTFRGIVIKNGKKVMVK